MSRASASAAAFLLGIPGCFQPSSDTQVAAANGGAGGAPRRGRTSAGTGSGSSTSGGGTSGGGSSGGSSGGSTVAGSSGGGSTGAPDAGFDAGCPAGLLSFTSELVDVGTDSPVPQGMVIKTYAADGTVIPGSEAVSDENGLVTVCTPGGEEIYFGISGADYPTTVTGNFIQSGDVLATKSNQQVLLISTQELGALTTVFGPGSGSEIYTSLGMIAIGVESESHTNYCEQQVSGWKFAITQLDGGALPPVLDGGQWGIAYLGQGGIPSLSQTETSNEGAALLFNVYSTGLDYTVDLLWTNTNADAGACLPITSPVEFTGRVVVGPNVVSVAPLELP